MLMNNNNPVPALGVIPGKFMLDHQTIDERKANAEDPAIAIDCYPGGADDENHNAMPGDLAFGRRHVRDVEMMDGEPNELGTVSVAGLHYGEYDSQRAMESEFYFLGVVTSEQRLLNPFDRNTPDANNGSATGRVGTFSVVNNGAKAFYPGDYVMWRFPDCKKTPGLAGQQPPVVNQRARYGASPHQFKPEIVPFDPTDLTVDLAGAYSAIMASDARNGVSNISFEKSLPNTGGDVRNARPFTCLQDEALSYKFGLMGVCLTFMECMIRNGLVSVTNALQGESAKDQALRLTQEIGLFSTEDRDQTLMREALADIFLTSIGDEIDQRNGAIVRFRDGGHGDPNQVAVQTPITLDAQYARLRVHLMQILTNGISGSVDSSRSKIIGRAMNSAAPGDTTHILFGHTV